MTSTPLTVEHTLSADGTRIGYERLGHGPGLVLVQGAMGTAYNFRELAQALADWFMVILPDRRGRGHSPRPYSPDYTIEDDVRDLDALLTSTGAGFVFGLSSGGDITLKAALQLPRVKKVALYEPAIFPNGAPRKGISRFDAYSAAGDLAGMLVTGMKVAELGPAFVRAMPDWMVKAALKRIIKQEEKHGSGGYASMAELAVAFPYDFDIVKGMDGTLPTFAALTQPLLLLGGSKSPAYLSQALDQLQRTIPHASRIELEGLDHAAAWNLDKQRNPHGNPEAIAEQLKIFFRTSP